MKVFLFSVLIIAIVMLLFSVKILLVKGGKFPNLHIDGSKAMKDRNIHCALKEDKLMRRTAKKIKE
ncbi:MAG: hypothetical protein MJZ08_00405 [Bacteroidaceae bacterium]|mgnify:CR=1 FL=1|nr:hypothetical protein [Bacteroidaceae bacterium]